jgi:hypothetical protein
MNLPVDNAIVNDLLEDPTRYWLYERGQPQIVAGVRRRAGVA